MIALVLPRRFHLVPSHRTRTSFLNVISPRLSGHRSVQLQERKASLKYNTPLTRSIMAKIESVCRPGFFGEFGRAVCMLDVASEAESPIGFEGVFLAVAPSTLVTQAYPSSILRQ